MIHINENILNNTIVSFWNSMDENEVIEKLHLFISKYMHGESWTLLFGRIEQNSLYLCLQRSSSQGLVHVPQSRYSDLPEGVSILTYTDFLRHFPEISHVEPSTPETIWCARKDRWLVILACNLNATHPFLHPAELKILLTQSISAIDRIVHFKELIHYPKYIEYMSQLKPVTDHQEEPRVVIGRILAIVENMFNAEAGIMLFDPRDEKLVLQSPAFRAKESEIKLYRLHPSEDGNASRVFVTGQAYFSNQAVGDPNIIQRFVRMYKVQNIATVPIEGKSGRIGVLHVINRKDRNWMEEDLKILHWISSQIGYILENARLLQTIAEQHEEAVKTAELLEKQNQLIEKQAQQLKIKTLELQESLSLHRLFTDILIGGQGLQGIIKTLSRKLHRSTLLLDKYLRILAMEVIEDDLQRGLIQYQPGDYFEFNPIVKRVPIQHMGQKFGTLVLYPGLQKNSDDQWENVILEQAKLTLCLELMNQKSIRESVQKTEANLIQMILKGDITNLDNLHREALRLGHNLKLEHVVMVVTSKEKNSEEEKTLDSLYDFIYYTLDRSRTRALAMKQPDHIVLLVQNQQNTEDAIAFSRRLIEEARKRYSHETIFIGLSRPCNQIQGYQTAYMEALKALSIAESLCEPIVNIDTFCSIELLFEIPEESAKKYVHRTIGPLIHHDKNKGGALLTTLLAYIESNGNIRETAKRCYSHINTIRYRIEKIETLLQCDLRSNKTLFDLHLALQLYQLHRNNN